MRTIAVIGHGRSPEGKGWGENIDACDVVIRMWDWQWQARKDYGTKYTFGLIEAVPQLLDGFYQHNERVPDEGFIASVYPHVPLSRVNLPEKTEAFDQANWSAFGKAMGGMGNTGDLRYTRGTLAALWAIDRYRRNGHVILVGFDSIKLRYAQPTEEAFSEAYQRNPGTFRFGPYTRSVAKDGSTTKHGNHDYAIERPVIEALAGRYAASVSFAQEVWT